MKFKRQFNSFYPTLQAIARRYAKATDIPYEEYESSLSEEFYLKYGAFDPQIKDNFTAYMRVVLTQRATRVASRKEREFYDRVEFFEGQAEGDDGEEIMVEFADDFDLETHVISKEDKKTDADKRQLINALLENTDPVTIRIITEYLTSENARPTAIGKALGIHHQTVIRKLNRLARNFNENKFGDINAYLAS